MRTKLARWSIFLAIALALFILAVYAQTSHDDARELTLTILHTNDLHAHDESFMERGRSIGGMARIAHLIQVIKQSHKDVLTVDAGDFYQGTTLFQRYGGETEISLLNQAGYDIVTLGNHEFDNGPEQLAEKLKAAKFSIISCNLDFSKVPALDKLVKPSVVKVVDGQKIAFIGAVTPELEHVALKTPPVKVKAAGESWMKPIAEEVERYKSEGVNKIVLVTHCGVELDKQLAQTLSDVDLIIGGHSHTRLDTPIWAEHADGSKTAIVQTGSYGRTLGELDLAFDKKGQLEEAATQYRLINITDRIKEDPEVFAYLREKTAPLLALRREIVGLSEEEFDNRFSNMPWDSAIGDLICDAIAEQGASYGARISLQNRGGIRARIEKGPMSEEKIRELLPFENRVVLATMDGEHLLGVLEHSVSGTSLGGSFLDVHGIKFGYDAHKPKGQRVVFALAENKEGDWQPIKADRTYRFAVNDYTFKGGEGYEFSTASDIVRLPDLLSTVFHTYLSKHKTVRPMLPNRIVPLTGGLADFIGGPKPQLLVHLPDPSFKTTFLYGKELGAEPFSKLTRTFPVPISGLSNPQMVRRESKSTAGGSELLVDSSGLKMSSQYPYLVVVCQPAKSASTKTFQVSYPILVNKPVQ
jgi:5'-nucleotidase / UDP-sugar diphosphatase